nr:hypothetical protein [Streptomyces sp. NBC_01462]
MSGRTPALREYICRLRRCCCWSSRRSWESLTTESPIGALGLVLNAVVLFNTRYMDAAVTTLCGGLPLSLALVAARAAANPHFALSAIAAELRDAHGTLDAFTNPDTNADIRSVFSWSYQALTPEAARLFRLLAELTDAYLLTEHTPGRFAYHDLLRAYAGELTGHLDPDAGAAAAFCIC